MSKVTVYLEKVGKNDDFPPKFLPALRKWWV